jgi:predicted PurR-regulated permease PerM
VAETDRTERLSTFLRRILTTIGIAALVVVLLLALWTAAQVLLLFFGALLLAILLRAAAEALAGHTPLSTGWSLALVVALLLVGTGLAAWFVAPVLTHQVQEFVNELPRALHRIEQFLQRYGWGEQFLTRTGGLMEWLEDQDVLEQHATTVFSWILNGISGLLIMFFIAVYFSAEPGLYTNGTVRLFPPARRPRAARVIAELGHTLRWWLLTRLVSMFAVGVLTTIMLLILGVPLAPLLGFQAFLLTFIPYIGPIAATIPIALVALAEGATIFLWAIVLYTAIQSLEGFLIMPLVQERIVHLPPAATLISEVLMGVWFGLIGIVFATPLAAALLPLVRMLYVEDVLGDQPDRKT